MHNQCSVFNPYVFNFYFRLPVLITHLDSVMQCCGIIDIEGTTVSKEAKVFQALHGIYIPHSRDQHSLLPENFPSHLYCTALSQQHDDLVKVSYGDMGFTNEYETNY